MKDNTPRSRVARSGVQKGQRITLAFLCAFIAALAVTAAVWGDPQAVLASLLNVSPAVLLSLALLSLVNYGLRAWRWHAFARHLGIPMTFGRTLLYYLAGFALLVTPGKIGELVRLWLLRRGHGTRYVHTLPLMAADRLSDGVAFAILVLASVSAFRQYRALAFGLAAILLASLLMLLKPWLLMKLIGCAYRLLACAPRLFAGARGVLRQMARIASPALLLGTLVLSLAGWLAEVWAFHLLLAAMGAGVGFARAVFIFSFAAVVGAMMFVPGGLGGTEATMIVLLVASGVDSAIAIAATLVIRTTTLWFAVLIGLVALPAAVKLTQPARMYPAI